MFLSEIIWIPCVRMRTLLDFKSLHNQHLYYEWLIDI